MTTISSETINDPAIVAELTEVSDLYEQALVTNDIDTMTQLFWDGEPVSRFGVTENLYGPAEIEAFRKGRPLVNSEREILRREVVTFGNNTGSVTVEFQRPVQGILRHGRQTQMWRKFPQGWKVVSAHVSFLP
ncbi:MAG: DUF3225 domain-containing protein [Synechococcaceae cyanobacterium RM1_1_27]|nr:DUF3225 domain-containing protein [Synechococcaceae cyanobacterium SM2_3_2]NJO85530.1 DUF3225 domain-containing protein [Synechococcaceae cyanobacterium RM1_1_27]